MNIQKQIEKKFKRCPICKKLFFGLRAHMHMHVKDGSMTDEEFDKKFRNKNDKKHKV